MEIFIKTKIETRDFKLPTKLANKCQQNMGSGN